MNGENQRAALQRLISERKDDYAGLSRLLGRNPAYIQQFIKRGTPKRLDEKDRRLLARYFGVDDEILGGPAPARGGGRDRFIPVPRLDIGASAGPGALSAEETPLAHMEFDAAWLRQLTGGASADLSMIRVKGDSMVPTLEDGDDILVDRGESVKSLRDGIYVLRLDDSLMVKRLARSPSGRRVAIKSDNDAYPSWQDVDLSEIDVIGRVIWAGRRIR